MSPPPSPKRAPAAATTTTAPCGNLTPREPAAAMETWASLPQDLVRLIGWRALAGDLRDYVRFRAACSHWHASTVRPRGRGVRDPRFHPRRWMLLPEPESGGLIAPGLHDPREPVRFFNLSTGAFARARLPLADGDHTVLDSVDGLLVLHRDRDTAIRILNPFTGDVAELPPVAPILPGPRTESHGHDVAKNSLSWLSNSFHATVAVSAAGEITVMLLLAVLRRVAYATAGDQRWALSAWEHQLSCPMSFQGKLYAMHFSNHQKTRIGIYKLEPPRPDAAEGSRSLRLPSPEKIAECTAESATAYNFQLVECGSELMLVCYSDGSRSHVLVHRLSDLAIGKFAPLTSIGGHALFFEQRRCVCVSPNEELPSVSGDSIICLLLHGTSVSKRDLLIYVAQYHLGNGAWSPPRDEDDFWGPSSDSHMLLHQMCFCCYRDRWNQEFCFRTAEPEF
ncbi:hypothetical protein ACP70R_036146 [Stipagrostis hirtigluma subsp. patula]